MSHHVSVLDLPEEGEKLDASRLSGASMICLGAGAVGLLISICIFLFGREVGDQGYSLAQAYGYSWLYAFMVFFTLGCGALFWVLLHNATNSGWGVAVRRVVEVMSLMIPVVGILGLPLVISSDVREGLWEWMAIHSEVRAQGLPDVQHGDPMQEALYEAGEPLLYAKYPYLNLIWWKFLPGWLPRYFIYFVLLSLGSFALFRFSVTQDKTGDIKNTFGARRFACGWLAIFAVCLTFGAMDWVKGLNYTWFSTMWGVYIFAGSALSSMAVFIIVTHKLKAMGYLDIVNEEHFHIMGKLLHAFTIFWAYIAFSQFFLIWYANITEETQFYLLRNTEGWNLYTIAFIFIGHFVIPFLLLLVRSVKKNPKQVIPICFWIILMHIADHYWLVVPERGPSLTNGESLLADYVIFLDPIPLITFGGIIGFVFIKVLGRQSLYPTGDPRLQESINLVN